MTEVSYVYLDSSFFFAAVHGQDGRMPEAKKIIAYELERGSRVVTSVMTLTEFTVRVHNKFRGKDEHAERVRETIDAILEIAGLVGFNSTVATQAANFEGILGKERTKAEDGPLRSRDLRWDAIHLATAEFVAAERIYGWDNKWSYFPVEDFPRLGEIICPAVCPQSGLYEELGPDGGEEPAGHEREVPQVEERTPEGADPGALSEAVEADLATSTEEREPEARSQAPPPPGEE